MGHTVLAVSLGRVRKMVQVSSSGPTKHTQVRKPKAAMTQRFFSSRPLAKRNPASMPPAP